MAAQLRVAAGLTLSLLLLGCAVGAPTPAGSSSADAASPLRLRLGYFPNLTHASALVGVEKGFFGRALGSGVTLETHTFNAGPAAVEALFADALDAAYIGPNPAINAFAKSKGEAIRIISGAASGGAFLVVSSDITDAADLKGRTLASPQLGGTQDVALRAWLADQGYRTDAQGGGDVSVVPQDNAQTLETFKAGDIAGAWVPEPWATRLLQEAGGKVLVDERTLWPEGRFVTTHLVVRTAFLRDHPDVVRHLLEGQVAATDFVNSRPAEAQQVTIAAIEKITGKRLPEALISSAWKSLTFTDDPVAPSLRAAAERATRLGFLEPVDLAGIYDLGLLNEVLVAAGKPKVSGTT